MTLLCSLTLQNHTVFWTWLHFLLHDDVCHCVVFLEIITLFYLELDIFVQKFKIKVYLHIYGVEMIDYWCQSEKLCSHAGSVSFAQSSVFTKHKTPWIRKCAKPNLTVIHSFRSIFYTSTHIWGSHMVPLSHISLSLICSANGPVGQNRADMKNHSFPEWFMGLNIRSHSSIPHQRV